MKKMIITMALCFAPLISFAQDGMDEIGTLISQGGNSQPKMSEEELAKMMTILKSGSLGNASTGMTSTSGVSDADMNELRNAIGDLPK